MTSLAHPLCTGNVSNSKEANLYALLLAAAALAAAATATFSLFVLFLPLFYRSIKI